MKTRYWVIGLALLLTACIGLSIPLLLPGQDAAFAQIISDGQVMHTVDLKTDRQIHISTANSGRNTITVAGGILEGAKVDIDSVENGTLSGSDITVAGGKIGVTEANCPDHYCMDRGMCSGGTQIVCLPNRLIIRFVGEQAVDSVAG